MWQAIKCIFGYHTFIYSIGNRLRACPHCLYREVYGNKYMGWRTHTYPLNADPSKDPTPISDLNGEDWHTMGEEYQWNQLWRDLSEKLPKGK